MFLAGIWCSTKKPPIAECLGPVLRELHDLATDGTCASTVVHCNIKWNHRQAVDQNIN